MGCMTIKESENKIIKFSTNNEVNKVKNKVELPINQGKVEIYNPTIQNVEKNYFKSTEVEEIKRKEDEDEEKKRKEVEEKKRKEVEEQKRKEEEEKKRKEEEEIKRKEEEEKKRKEEEEKKRKEEEEIKRKEEEEQEYLILKEEEISKTLETDFKTPSKNCIFLGIHGSFYTEKQKSLDYLNKIRKEACDEGVKNPKTGKKLKPSDYIPFKWSTDMEIIARIRAMESIITMGHSRLNGNSIWECKSNGAQSYGENLAWNWENANSIDMINQWYEEKKYWVTGKKGVTGHYESIISTRYRCVGLGWFNSSCGKYPSCLCGEFSDEKGLKEDFLDEKINIIQIVDVLKKNVKNYYLEGKKNMNTDEEQILIPRVNLSYGNSIWPLNKYELNFFSSNDKILRVNKYGKVNSIKSGNATITCKKKDNSVYAKFNINVKCTHQKELINTIESTCTKKGTKNFECKICNIKNQESIDLIPHEYNYSFPDSKKKECKGTCKFCNKTIKFTPPNQVTFYWRNNETAKDSYYSGSVPNDNPIGSTIVCWASDMNGDKNYRDIVFETNDKNLLEFPKEFKEMTEFKVIGSGEVELTVYLKYNPQIKEVFTLTVG